MIIFYVAFIVYKVAEYLYETLDQIDKEVSRKFCRCELFKSLFVRICCKRANTTSVEVQELKRTNTPFKAQDKYSDNIFEEMTIEDIKREYQKTKADH